MKNSIKMPSLSPPCCASRLPHTFNDPLIIGEINGKSVRRKVRIFRKTP